jgi:hypothetical protein
MSLTLQKNTARLPGMILIVIFLAWQLQSQLLLNWDVSWLMHASARLMAGGTYSNNFFEINPPLILYLYMPPVFLAKHSSVALIVALRSYIILLGSLSLIICNKLVKIIFRNNTFIQLTFMLMLAVVYFLLPSFEFGQRENLLLIFSMPYLLLVATRLQGRTWPVYVSLGIGIVAGLGFALKPYFLLTPFFIELYYCSAQRKLFAWLRPESLAIAGVMGLYTLFIVIFFRDYLTVVIPTVRRIYPAFTMLWPTVLAQPVMVFCEISLLFFVVCYQTNPYKKSCDIFLLAIFSYLITYFIQHTLWYYHIYPALGLTLLLVVMILCVFLQNTSVRKRDYAYLGALGYVFFAFLFYATDSVWIVVVFKLVLLMGFLGSIIGVLMLPPQRTNLFFKTLLFLFFCLMWGFLIHHFELWSYWSAQRLVLTSVCFLILLGIMLPKSRLFHFLFVTGITALILAYPLRLNYVMYNRLQLYKQSMQPLIAYMHEHALNQPVYFFSTRAGWEFPPVDYAGSIPAGRMAFLGWVPAVVKQEHSQTPHLLDADKKFFMAMANEDLQRDKPLLVFVETERYKPYLENLEFDYLAFFSQSPRFLTLWKNYRYIATIDDPGNYKFDVYQLNQHRE